MAAFMVSSFGGFVMGLFAGLFTIPSEQTLTVLAYGWAVASGERQTITTYLWLTGATTVKHFSCFYRFLGGALYQSRWQLWARIIGWAAQWVPQGAPIVLIVDDSTKKKAGRQIEGVGHYRTGAGSARQEYRTLRGLTFVWGLMRVPVPGWPGQSVSVPIGLSLYLKEEQAQRLQLPYQSRSTLAREIVDFVAAQLPTRRIRALGDGGYATKDYLHQLPATVDMVSRMLITGKLYALPPQHTPPRRISANLSSCGEEVEAVWRKDAEEAQESRDELADAGLVLSPELEALGNRNTRPCAVAWVSLSGRVDARAVVARGTGVFLTRDRRACADGAIGSRVRCRATEAVAWCGGMVPHSLCGLVARARTRDAAGAAAVALAIGR